MIKLVLPVEADLVPQKTAAQTDFYLVHGTGQYGIYRADLYDFLSKRGFFRPYSKASVRRIIPYQHPRVPGRVVLFPAVIGKVVYAAFPESPGEKPIRRMGGKYEQLSDTLL
jgi:hypothetical protein